MYQMIKKTYLYIIIFVIIFTGLCINLPAKISYEGVANFDWWSNDIMISDMMYYENYGSDGYFLNSVTPDDISPNNPLEAEGVQPEMFKDGEFFEKNVYHQYTSNIVIQRFFYRWIDTLLYNSHDTLLKVLYLINCALAALMVTGIFYWISDFASPIVMILCTLILSFACPYFAMYGKNLYWCMYNLFLPTFAMCIVLRKGKLFEGNNNKKNIVLFLSAFVSCFIKMMMYFEFVTTVMISMTIPIFYYCFLYRYKLQQIIKTIIWPFIGAMTSFVLVFGLKIGLLVMQFGSQETIYLINDNLGKRILGNIDAGMQSYGPYKVSLLMMQKEFMAIKGLFSISFRTTIMIAVAIFIYVVYNRTNDKISLKYRALVYTTALSILAPFSWFVLAAPHTTVHNQYATINFFIPFGILIIILVEKTICNIWSRIKYAR